MVGTPPGSLPGTPLLNLNKLVSGVQPGRIPAGDIIWPFPTRSASQYRRIDQGWDLQYGGTRPVPIYAITSGTVETGSNPGGFGQQYPVLMFNTPIGGNVGAYYGHVFVNPAVIGKQVHAGQIIGHTGGTTSGGNAAGTPNWLEIGFLGPGGSYPVMGAGAAMRAFLARALPVSAFTRPKPPKTAAKVPAPGAPRTLPLLPPPLPPRRKPAPRPPAKRPAPKPTPRARLRLL